VHDWIRYSLRVCWFNFKWWLPTLSKNQLPTSDIKQDNVPVVSHPHCLFPLICFVLSSHLDLFIPCHCFLREFPTKIHYKSPILTYKQQDQVLITDPSYACCDILTMWCLSTAVMMMMMMMMMMLELLNAMHSKVFPYSR
jgi:hypothetical protein